jgi:hypothetical protein
MRDPAPVVPPDGSGYGLAILPRHFRDAVVRLSLDLSGKTQRRIICEGGKAASMDVLNSTGTRP